jgi:hypothetical protein
MFIAPQGRANRLPEKKAHADTPRQKLFSAATGVRVRASPSPAQLTSHAPAITAEACL